MLINSVQKDRAKELLDPAIKGTTSLLHSAVKGLQIQAVVITSSFVSFFFQSIGSDTYKLPLLDVSRFWTSGISRVRMNRTRKPTGIP